MTTRTHEADMLLTHEQVQERLQVSPATVYRFELEGRIPPARHIGRRTARWAAADLDRWEREGCPRGLPMDDIEYTPDFWRNVAIHRQRMVSAAQAADDGEDLSAALAAADAAHRASC